MFGSMIMLVLLLGVLAVVVIGTRWFWLRMAAPQKTPGMGAMNSEGNKAMVSGFKFDSLGWRSIIVGLVGLVMLVPLGMVADVVNERNNLYHDVLYDISKSWGSRQDLRGPVLVVPFTEHYIEEESIKDSAGNVSIVKKKRYTKRFAFALPDQLDVQANIDPQQRKRGIYESLVYTAELALKGSFTKPDIESLSNNIETIHWDKAWLAVGLSDTRAISEASRVLWDNATLQAQPGTGVDGFLESGFQVPLTWTDTKQQKSFDLALTVNGSDGFFFAPFGEKTHVEVTSTWPHPSFQGKILPDSRNITEDGFTAVWDIPHLARNYPQLGVWGQSQYDAEHMYTTGVSLFEPVFLYSLITRAAKYGVLFIFLTFMTFLVFELSLGAKLHYVQYGLIGLALSLFFLTLLSLAEHIAFLKAYMAASAVVVLMIAAYTSSALKSLGRGVVVGIMLIALYAVLYALLQLEDYALLLGSALLIVVTGILMFVTRHVRSE